MLCGAGSRDTNVRRAFNLHDTNSDGSLSIEEFQTYLRSMFNTMMNSDRKTFGESSPLGVNADQLAHATAELAFKEAGIDVNDGGRMSFEQFSRWYVVFSHSMSSYTTLETPTLEHRYKRDTHDVRAQVSRESSIFDKEDSTNFIDDNNDDEMPDYGLEDIDASEMFEMFANVTENDGTISKEKFHQVMDSRSNSDPDNLFHLFGTWCSSARVGL
tara:strand:- start:2542 stop:3186 length:645 start_codon:yes stop_codon:yes gene_type:complete